MGDDRKIYLHDCDECHEPIKDRRILCGACIRPWAEPGSHWVCSECVALLDELFRRGCVVGAAIVAWGDAMREREEAKRRAKDWEDRRLEEDMGG